MLVKGNLTADEKKLQKVTTDLVKKRSIPPSSRRAIAALKAYVKARKASTKATEWEIGDISPVIEVDDHDQFARELFSKKFIERSLLLAMARNGMVHLFDALKEECTLSPAVIGDMLDVAVSHDQDIFVKEMLPSLSEEMLKTSWRNAVAGSHFNVALVLLGEALANVTPAKHDRAVEEILVALMRSSSTSLVTVAAVLDLVGFTKSTMSAAKLRVCRRAVEQTLAGDSMINVHILREIFIRADPIPQNSFTVADLERCVFHLNLVLNHNGHNDEGGDNESFIELANAEPGNGEASDGEESRDGEELDDEDEHPLQIVCARVLLTVFGNIFPKYKATGLNSDLLTECCHIFAGDVVTHLVLDLNGYHDL